MTDSKSGTRFSGPTYVTKAVHSLVDGTQRIVTSRRHRKGRGPILLSHGGVKQVDPDRKNPWLRLWAPSRLTWWVAVLFIIGSALFSVGGYCITFPQDLPEAWTNELTVDWVFFIGSIFFTSAAFCQLLESINAGDSEGLLADETISDTFLWVAWHPQRIGYMACVVQLAGTVMFNINTGSAFLPELIWMQQNVVIWTPNIIGSICFLIASRLAYMEVCHSYWAWQPGKIEWWITALNLLGSIGFMISALYSLAVPPEDVSEHISWLSAFFTFQGAVCFFVASYLLLPEMFSD